MSLSALTTPNPFGRHRIKGLKLPQSPAAKPKSLKG